MDFCVQIEKLVEVLVRHEVKVTTDSNTLFRGNSLVTKVVDELIKKISMSYLQRTLQSIIDEVIVDKIIDEATYYYPKVTNPPK